MREKIEKIILSKIILITTIFVIIITSLIITVCLKYDRYVNELEEKVNKYEIENKRGDLDDRRKK